MEELSQKDIYNQCIDMGKSHNEAIDTIIDFWTGGLSASWDSNRQIEARKTVEANLLASI